jgi:hypothetical protein
MQRHSFLTSTSYLELGAGPSVLALTLGKTVPVLTTIPIAIAKNAVRIFTLSMLGIHVNSAFLDGRPHRNGGKAEARVARPSSPPLPCSICHP